MQPQWPSGGAPAPTDTPTDSPTVPLPGVGKRATCPVCGTTFAPRDSAGKCPVCGEQVMRQGQADGRIPIISPAWQWLRQGGNWRLAAVAGLIVYQLILFIVLWIHLAQVHAL
jgi:hypothetical protein